ncbi:MAG: DUF438 domain-containing protein [Candidatus Heimdallarchaeota archaeon]
MQDKKSALKKLIEDLNKGKDLEEAKKEFQQIITETGPDELAKVEEELVKEGMPREKLNQLCEVHLAVFKERLGSQKLIVKKGHPLAILMEEHRILLEYVQKLNTAAAKIAKKKGFKESTALMADVKDVARHLEASAKHYLREENVLFPFIEKHGLTEPPAQMWIDHDNIRATKKTLYDIIQKADEKKVDFKEFKEILLKTANELVSIISSHFFKENNVLFPASMRLLTAEEWDTTRKEFDEIGYCCFTPEDIIKPEETKEKAATAEKAGPPKQMAEGVIEFETGPLPIAVIEPILNTLPVDITFVDENDIVRYFSKGDERIFVRTKAIIGRAVINCHPQKSYDAVERILTDFREGKRKTAEFWINLNDRMIYIRYFAVHDKNGKYLGTLEVSQDITEIQKLKGEKRLLD